MNKFTEGPWKRDGWNIRGCGPADPIMGAIVCKVLPWDESGCRQEDNANAHLIAAAPDLYAALEALLFECEALDNVVLWNGINALKKARGEA